MFLDCEVVCYVGDVVGVGVFVVGLFGEVGGYLVCVGWIGMKEIV